MVVRNDERTRANTDCRLEYLSRMDKRGGGSPNTHDLVADGTVSAVEVDRQKVLSRFMADETSDEGDNADRRLKGRIDQAAVTAICNGNLADVRFGFAPDSPTKSCHAAQGAAQRISAQRRRGR